FIAGVGQMVTVCLVAAIRRATGVDVSIVWLFSVLGALVLIPLIIASAVDKRIGATLAPDSTAARAIEAVARVVAVVGLSRLMGPMLLVFTSRMGQVRGIVGILLGVYAVFGIVMAQVFISLGVWSPDGYRFLAQEGRSVLTPSHYRDQRTGNGIYETTPFLPSEVVSGSWVRLFVPYRIEHFDAAAERACPTAVAEAALADTARARAGRDSVVACLGRVLDVRLDDQPLQTPTWMVATDVESGLRGLVTYVPIATQAEGPHRVSLVRLPRKSDRAKAGATPPVLMRREIPFWIDRTGNR
ncbi:MAG: hypothetical protein MUF00_17365, partial [Gemmatimonadaceae bacterium]|nr:hypothetical protein [Gemmatimonadaceae bacterium]